MKPLRKLISALVLGSSLGLAMPSLAEAPFGNKDDLELATSLWALMEYKGLAGDNAVMTRPYKGMPPHGMILELIETPVKLHGQSGPLIVKRNYGGDGISVDDVINDPARYLQAVTIMLKREAGYDADNGDWFYVKYDARGNVMKNPKGIALAGRVAKGMPTGCIACHQAAEGSDFVFNHDRYK
ncbi:cytochrome P460 family protein [Marinobacterium sediminicola]|uniref:Cytochrome P460 n=1 Tax=Marinobacterium sediminicola TaxID=518898 RepID=A0ABY1S1I2_9GAMM|nr:cytochrome P460 family protein [Marinobacterium sediminicola]ULG69394.1 cytochrome P460 family protein [Marinobacterium sediminicola]SMR75542.1 Cytochrome P460 [Marinobacterium sediminicola]